MSKRCVLIDPTVTVAELQVPVGIDWAKCLLCQKQTRDALQCPASTLRSDKGAGYYLSLADILHKFEQIGQLPSHLVLSRVDDGNGLAAAFAANKACWHKSCRSDFSPRGLSRIQTGTKRPLELEETATADDEPSARSTSKNLKRLFTRSDFDSDNPLRAKMPVCFFCDLSADRNPLHDVTTFELDTRVKECALALSDHRLLAKLATSDMIALEAKYHAPCLARLYNQRRSMEREHYRQVAPNSSESNCSIAFAELTAYINDVRSVSDIMPYFKLIDLKTLYTDRLRQLDPDFNQFVNSTRLKDNLLAHFPDMHAETSGVTVTLGFKENVGAAVSKACSADLDQDALHLARAAEIVRREMFSSAWTFDNSLHRECQEKSVPHALLTLVKMVLEGPGIDVQSIEMSTQAALTISQLIVFNSVRHKRTAVNRVSQAVRHSRDQETPLPLYVGLTVHAMTRKKRLVDRLFDLGLSVSYDRVLCILNDLAAGVCDRFEIEGAVCPFSFKSDIFTTAAVDNLDHNPSSTTAQTSFHGTAISLHQHPDPTMLGSERPLVCLSVPGVLRKGCSLPADYLCIPPIHLLKQEPPISSMSVKTVEDAATSRNDELSENEWLSRVWNSWQAGSFSSDCVTSWSAFHAQQQVMQQVTQSTHHHLSVSGMLPLFHEHAQSVSMIRHAMNIIHTSVSKLNPGQVPVIAFDQPLYTIGKLIQWNWPDLYGQDKFLLMFGGLHIEMAALKALGSLLTGSGWVEALANAGILTSGSAEALLSASHVRRCRRTHELTLAALHILQQIAYKKHCEAEGSAAVSFNDWCSQQKVEHRQFAFWSSVMQLETSVLLFVRSLRTANFSLYVSSLSDLMPWFFILDRTNYARWLSVHVCDMKQLPVSQPDIYRQFEIGKFTVQKTCNAFSALPIDHAHEQLNATVKGDGGIVGITESDSTLNRWIVSGPEVARLLQEFESDAGLSSSELTGSHHEQNHAAQESFVSDVKKLIDTLLQMGNPFEDQHDLIALHSRSIVTGDVTDLAGKLFDMGKEQYASFVATRLCNTTESLFAPIKRNKLLFFVNPKPSTASKAKSKIIASRNDSALFSRLYVACQIRKSDLDQFFSHENQTYPPSLSDAGDLHFGCKSDLLSCLDTIHPSVDSAPDVDATVLDGSVVVNMLKPRPTVKTFADYARDIFLPYIYSQLSRVSRVDVVWDQYEPNSIKGLARAKRGIASRQQVSASAPVPSKWHDFLRCDENKTALFCFLAEQMCSRPAFEGKHLIGTYRNSVKSSLQSYDTSQLEPCGHEEADTRMILHAADMASVGLTRILLRTVDTDVVVLAVAFYQKLGCDELWLAFGTGQHLRFIPAHELAAAFGPQRSLALPFFHALTGCDTVSAFVGRGKKTCWEVWKKFPEVTDTFVELFHMPIVISDSCLTALQRFVILLYDSNCHYEAVNIARKKLFANKGKTIENIPPTLDALQQHLRRAVYQAGHIWSQCLTTEPKQPNPSDWGWQIVDGSWRPLWMTIPDAANCCPELKRCGCKTGCMTKRCKCVKDNIQCTALCACDGECRQ